MDINSTTILLGLGIAIVLLCIGPVIPSGIGGSSIPALGLTLQRRKNNP